MAIACETCGGESPDGFGFCGHCGVPLPARPPEAAEAGSQFRFCGHCGSPLSDAAAAFALAGATAPGTPLPQAVPVAPPAHTPTHPHTHATSATEQRRRVAILFADLVGSTEIGDRFEAETVYLVVSGCLEGLGRIVEEEGGYVVKALGDGLMALFGAPVAYGDDPERAARAGIRMQAWLCEYAGPVEARYGAALRLRIGINYGSVVAAAMPTGGRPVYDVLGDAVNVAKRIEAAAEPGTVYVNEPFYRITRDAFGYQDIGSAQLKGKREPLALFRLVDEREIAAQARFPLLGRTAELESLRSAANALRRGRGGLLALYGEQGMGKSRLLDELAQELTSLGLATLRGAGEEATRTAPLTLWRTWLFELLPVEARMSHAEATESIREALASPEHTAWAEWLAALAVEPQRLLSLDAEGRDRITRGALRVLLDNWRSDRPACLVVDEAGLLDSLSFTLLVEAAAATPPILVTLAGRETAAFPPAGVESVRLGPLSPERAAELLAGALPDMSIPPEIRERVAERAGGNPLFLESVARAARASADPIAALAAIPDTLYGQVQAQVDALGGADLGAIQAAAVTGKNFVERWLHSVCDEGLVEQAGAGTAWRGLEARGLLVEQRPAPRRELQFRHGAVQEVVYESLLQSRRQQLHARAARAIVPDAALRPELAAPVANHWRRAEVWEEALDWTFRAADHAAALFAGQEAEALYEGAHELAERLDAPAATARAAAGLAGLAAHRGEFPRAIALFQAAEAALPQPPAEGEDPDLRLQRATLARTHARVLALTGTPSAAVPLLERALTLLTPDEEQARPKSRIQNPNPRMEQVLALTQLAHALCDLGELEAARNRGQEALEQSGALEWPSGIAGAGAALGRIYPLLGQWPEAERELARAADMAESVADWQQAAACRINLGNGLQSAGRFAEARGAFEAGREHADRIDDREKAALVRLNLGTLHLNWGDWLAAEAAYRGAADRFRSMSHPLGVAASLGNLADALRYQGRVDEAAAAVDEAGAAQEQVDAPFLGARLAAIRAELALARGDAARAAELAAGSLALAEASGHGTAVGTSRLALGRALRALGDPAAAARELQAATEEFERLDEALDAARARAEWAAAMADQGLHLAAAPLRDRATAMLRQLGADSWLTLLPPSPH